MTATLGFPMLLAEAEQWREMGRDFRVDHTKLDPGLIFASIVVLVTVVGFLWFLHRLMNCREGRRLYNSPKQLFRSLCNLHELTRSERRILSHLARVDQLPQPACVFLEPDRFDAAMKAPAFQSQRKQLEQLRAKLFAGMNDAMLSEGKPMTVAAE
jgi:hypothetical protein